MDQLPKLVKSALISACNSGKPLQKNILIQLVWKDQQECPSAGGKKNTRVGSNWKWKYQQLHGWLKLEKQTWCARYK